MLLKVMDFISVESDDPLELAMYSHALLGLLKMFDKIEREEEAKKWVKEIERANGKSLADLLAEEMDRDMHGTTGRKVKADDKGSDSAADMHRDPETWEVSGGEGNVHWQVDLGSASEQGMENKGPGNRPNSKPDDRRNTDLI